MPISASCTGPGEAFSSLRSQAAHRWTSTLQCVRTLTVSLAEDNRRHAVAAVRGHND